MELRDLYNSKRILTGEVIEKGQDVPSGRYYITVVVFIENGNGEFLLQKREPFILFLAYNFSKINIFNICCCISCFIIINKK